jgi:hypothetical protein
MTRKSLFTYGMVLALAAILTFVKVPVSSAQGTTLAARYVKGDLPTDDPDAPAWERASAIEVPLSAQTVTRPILTETSVRSLTARALHNGSKIAILVEWKDATNDSQILTVQDFRDAVAVQFPLAVGQPFFCMGQQGGNVNIWHWKADWQADLDARRELELAYPNMNVDQYPFAKGESPAASDYTDPNYVPAYAAGNLAAAPHASPVEDLIAGGFGSLTSQPPKEQNVQGSGAYANDGWRVIFSRDLASAETDDVSFAPDQVYSMAFAVWDGANGERNGQKSTSQWVALQLDRVSQPVVAEEAEAPGLPVFVQFLLVLLGLIVLLILLSGGITGVMMLLSKQLGKKK